MTGRTRRGPARDRRAAAPCVRGKAAEANAANAADAADKAREKVRMSGDLGRAVYGRRRALGISQAELARRADMTQPQVSRLELGGAMPTLAVLARLARGLEATFALTFDGGEPRVVFEPLPRPAGAAVAPHSGI